MRKNMLLLLLGICIAGFARSQQLTPSIIASDGGINKAAGISLEWTLGELTVESLSTADRLYTQGFHQPLLVVKNLPLVEVKEVKMLAEYKITVAPNPVLSILMVNINTEKKEKLNLTLTDVAGRQILVQAFNGRSNTTQIDMSRMTSGVYVLELRNLTGQLIKSFQVIKVK